MVNETLITFDIQCVDARVCVWVWMCLSLHIRRCGLTDIVYAVAWAWLHAEKDAYTHPYYFIKLAHHWCTSLRSKDNIKQLCMAHAWSALVPWIFFHEFYLHSIVVNCICFHATKWQENRDEKKSRPHIISTHMNIAKRYFSTKNARIFEFDNLVSN